MSSMLFLYNPNSGMKTVGRKLDEILNLYTSAGWDVTVHPTQSGEDCTATAMRYANFVDRIVVAGGDGTLNGAINGFIRAGLDKPFGYIPCGSTNDFSHSLGVPVQIMPAAKNAVSGVPFEIDIGCMNGRYFSYVAGFGLFTEVTYTTPQAQKNSIGYLAYLIAGAASLQNIVPYHIKFTSAERSAEGEYILGLITNTLQVGGMKNILPQDIALNDGFFEVLMVKKPRNPLDFNKLVSAIMKRDFSAECFEYFKTDSISFLSEKPLSWTLDGENGGTFTETSITCHPRALSIIVKG